MERDSQWSTVALTQVDFVILLTIRLKILKKSGPEQYKAVLKLLDSAQFRQDGDQTEEEESSSDEDVDEDEASEADGDRCVVCALGFNFVRRKRECRQCGFKVCSGSYCSHFLQGTSECYCKGCRPNNTARESYTKTIDLSWGKSSANFSKTARVNRHSTIW